MPGIEPTRLLFCIGCNDYRDTAAFEPLETAEKDANAVFAALAEEAPGVYDPDASKLLLSPDLDDIRAELKAMILQSGPIDTLTFFFAGHGTVHNGSLYLCVRDTLGSGLSVSAFSLSDLLRMVGDQQIRHTNIIIDACQSGGLLLDLNAILKTDAIGARDTPGVTLLAMAASNESASEDDAGGLGTQALLDCVRGARTLNTERPFLDLMDIGRAVSESFDADPEQQPVCWGLNLTSAAVFCQNPKHAPTKGAASVTAEPALVHADFEIAERDKNWFWKTYLSLTAEWDARAFYERLSTVLHSNEATDRHKIAFIRQTAYTFAEQAKQNSDRIVAAEIHAICGLALLRLSQNFEILDAESEDLFQEAIDISQLALAEFARALDGDPYALLGEAGGAFDLYYLPIRMSKILGWSGLGLISAQTPKTRVEAEQILKLLTQQTLDQYPLCYTAMNDCQAGPMALFGAGLKHAGLVEELARSLELFMNALATQKGLIADSLIADGDIFDFLVHRTQGSLDLAMDLVAKPSELVAVCLRLASFCDMTEAVDDCLIDLDHLAINAYLPVDYVRIGDGMLEGGVNATMRIGFDIFTVEEFEKLWPTAAVAQPKTRAQALANMLASLIFNDRVAWSEIPVGS